MISQGQKKVDRQPHSQSLAVMPRVESVVATEFRVTVQTIAPKGSFSCALASPSPGRAPPINSTQFTV
jgi:hypothetical protein